VNQDSNIHSAAADDRRAAVNSFIPLSLPVAALVENSMHTAAM
jgi:hypothetical protein